jgi:hypothetical protein
MPQLLKLSRKEKPLRLTRVLAYRHLSLPAQPFKTPFIRVEKKA